MQQFRFTAQEFDILWSAYGRDRMPYPLKFRPEEMDFVELRQQREAAAATLIDKHDNELERAMRVLLQPEVRVELRAVTDDPARIYRFHGAISGQAGAVAEQQPGSTPDTGGDVTVWACAPREVAKCAVLAVPNRPAGSRPSIEVRHAELTAQRQNHSRDPWKETATQKLDKVFRQDREALGEVGIHPGAAIDGRATSGRTFWWLDNNDGRYYIRTGDPIIAKPMDAPAMAAEINHLATTIQTEYRKEQEHDEYLRATRPRSRAPWDR